MWESSETKVFIPEEHIAESSEVVNRWLVNNDHFIAQPPAEIHIMSELNELRLSRKRHHPGMPLYFPVRSLELAGEITVSPMVPAYTTPLRQSYDEMTEGPNETKTSFSTLADMTVSQMVPAYTTPLREPYDAMAVGPNKTENSFSTHQVQNPKPMQSEIQIPTQYLSTQTVYEPPVTETNPQQNKDTVVSLF